MAARNPPWAVDGGGSHAAEDIRRIIGALLAGYTGVVEASDLAVTAQGTPARSVNVAAGGVFIPATGAGLVGPYFAYNDANVVLSTAVGDAVNPRYDIVVAAYNNTTKTWGLSVVQGTPDASPVDPTLPDNSVRLARLSIQQPPNDTVSGGDITNLRDTGLGVDQSWTPLTLSGSWVNGPGFVSGFIRLGQTVTLRGDVRSGSGAIATLPFGARPTQLSYFPVPAGGAFGVVSVSTAGVVSLVVGSNTDVGLDNVTFVAGQ